MNREDTAERIMTHAFQDELEKISSDAIVRALRRGKVDPLSLSNKSRELVQSRLLAHQAGHRIKSHPMDIWEQNPIAREGYNSAYQAKALLPESTLTRSWGDVMNRRGSVSTRLQIARGQAGRRYGVKTDAQAPPGSLDAAKPFSRMSAAARERKESSKSFLDRILGR